MPLKKCLVAVQRMRGWEQCQGSESCKIKSRKPAYGPIPLAPHLRVLIHYLRWARHCSVCSSSWSLYSMQKDGGNALGAWNQEISGGFQRRVWRVKRTYHILHVGGRFWKTMEWLRGFWLDRSEIVVWFTRRCKRKGKGAREFQSSVGNVKAQWYRDKTESLG